MNPKELKVIFGDNYKIDVDYKGFTVKTDRRSGKAADRAIAADYFWSRWPPAPSTRGLPPERRSPSLGIVMTTERGGSQDVDKMTITVDLPAGFPEKYRFALVKAIDHCTVKAHIQRAPQFEIVTRP
jgi:ribosomal protein S12 methylthiotransferase accessory factor